MNTMLTTCAVAVVLFAVPVRAVWLTNGVWAGNITAIGDMTGDGVPDACAGMVYINIATRENPTMQQYLSPAVSQGWWPVSILRNSDGKWFTCSRTNFGPEVWVYHVSVLTNDCTWFCMVSSTGRIANAQGCDIDGDGYFDGVFTGNGIAQFFKGQGSSVTRPFVTNEIHGVMIRTPDGTMLSVKHRGKAWLTDINADGDIELVINSNDWANSDIYSVTSPSNCTYIGTGVYVQCLGDWNGDGVQDTLLRSGEIILGVPEPVIIGMPLLLFLFARR